METPDYLPLGSIVSLTGGKKTMMIVGRALIRQTDEGGKEYFDYGMCLYPEGQFQDVIFYANHDCIDKVYFEGFRNEAEGKFLELMREIVPTTKLPKGTFGVSSEW